MKPIKLIYWYYKNWGPNYGDFLSPYIINKLSGRPIQHCFGSGFPVDYLIRNKLKKYLGRNYDHYLFPWEPNIISIGSIMSRSTPASKVWGTGILDPKFPIYGGEIFAVRGKLTLEELQNRTRNKLIRINQNVALGDPGLLISKFLPKCETLHPLGIIPHFSEYQWFVDNFSHKYKIIKLMSKDIEKTTSDISSCNLILSSSLHGLIVAHSYGIPALWIEHDELHPGTNGFKFYDYFSCVGIPPYIPIKNIINFLKNSSTISNLFNSYQEFALPHENIEVVQHNLLNVAPFKIK